MTLRTPVGNGIDWKVGVWDTIIGYESTSDPLNPNYTRSYGYTIEPTTHTGILATYKINDMVTFQAGIADMFRCRHRHHCSMPLPRLNLRRPTWVQLHSPHRTARAL